MNIIDKHLGFISALSGILFILIVFNPPLLVCVILGLVFGFIGSYIDVRRRGYV